MREISPNSNIVYNLAQSDQQNKNKVEIENKQHSIFDFDETIKLPADKLKDD